MARAVFLITCWRVECRIENSHFFIHLGAFDGGAGGDSRRRGAGFAAGEVGRDGASKEEAFGDEDGGLCKRFGAWDAGSLTLEGC